VTTIRTAWDATGAVALAIALLSISGCGQRASSTPTQVTAAPLLISSEDLVTVSHSALASGPSITGSLAAERRADLRAEVSSVVLAVLKENGDPVQRGDLLVRLDPTAIRDSLMAAEASARAATQAFEQSERQHQRMVKMRETGMISAQQLEDVERQRNNAQSDSEAARTRVVTARQQLQRTEVRAPFSGVVSDRKVSAGDTAAMGKELMKVVDPASLRFEGRVSADNVGQIAAGQRVKFRVNGFAETDFAGTVTRVNPAASAATRQVEVLVAFDDPQRKPTVAGLYAEGRIETRSTATLLLPATSVVRDGDATFAWRIKGDTLHKVRIELGDRNARTGQFPVVGGLTEGETVLRYPNLSLKDGQHAQLLGSAPQPAMVAEK
jgi:membrane fusion protein (multidrug efflux system)